MTERVLTILTVSSNVLNIPFLLLILRFGKGKPILSIFSACNLVHFTMALAQIAIVIVGYTYSDGGLSNLEPLTYVSLCITLFSQTITLPNT
jgi:hypothetical protein